MTDTTERYGRGPAMDAIEDMRAWNASPPEERKKAAAQFVRDRLAAEAVDGEKGDAK